MATKTANTPAKHHIQPPSLFSGVGVLVILCAAVVVFFFLDVAFGSVNIPFKDLINILAGKEGSQPAWANIIFQLRLPKAITAILAGAALSVGGLQMQTLFRNPLAGPSVLGVTAGASLGVAAVMLTSGGITSLYTIRQLGLAEGWLVVMASSLGAAAVLLLILAISFKVNDNVVLLIVGIMLGNVTISLVSIWQYFSEPEQLKDYLLWTFGSLGGVTLGHLKILVPIVGIGLLLTFFTSKWLNGMLLGEHYARSMGLPINQARTLIIITTSLLAGSVTGFCGPIGFIGIAVPHLARALFNTSDHRILIPGTCLVGALIMLICDLIAQWPGSAVTLPINAITALVGSPVVIWIIMKRRNIKSNFS